VPAAVFNTKTGSFLIDNVTADAQMGATAYYAVTLGDGRNGYIREYELIGADTEEVHAKKLAEKAECDRRGGVRIGMTRAQVYASCWGQPSRVNTTSTARGDHEQLVYGGNYLYLDNGVLTSIQTTQGRKLQQH
jgi:hypothetical protein